MHGMPACLPASLPVEERSDPYHIIFEEQISKGCDSDLMDSKAIFIQESLCLWEIAEI